MTQDFKNFLKFFLDISVFFVTFEILSQYPKMTAPIGLINPQWITDKSFRAKLTV